MHDEQRQKEYEQHKKQLVGYLAQKDWDAALLLVKEQPFYLGEVFLFANTLAETERNACLQAVLSLQSADSANIEETNEQLVFTQQVQKALREENWFAFFQAAYQITTPSDQNTLSFIGHRFLQEGKMAQGMWALYFAVRNPNAEPETWNNFIHASYQVKEEQLPPPSILKDLFEQALLVAPINPYIYHNLANFYVRAGCFEKAIQAVCDAVKYGYPFLELIQNDDDFIPLQSDSRWKTLFSETYLPSSVLNVLGPLPLSKLVFWQKRAGERVSLLQPGFRAMFFLEGHLSQVAQAAAQALEQFLAYLPDNTIRVYQSRGYGTDAPILKGKIKRDLHVLKNFPMDRRHIAYRYKSASPIGDYQFSIFGYSAQKLTRLIFDFPALEWQKQGVESFLDFLLQLADILPFQSGYAGLAFPYASMLGTNRRATLLSERFLGCLTLEPQTIYLAPHKLCGAQFLTFVGNSLLSFIGDRTTLEQALPETKMYSLTSGICIRAAQIPPMGYPSFAPQDLGLLPEVVRYLLPWIEVPPPQKNWLATIVKIPIGPFHHPALYLA